MNRERKEDTIVTYISTLNINLAVNEYVSQIDSTPDQGFRSRNSFISTDLNKATERKDVTSVYRKPCERSSGTFFQLFSSSHQHEIPHEGENSTFQRSKAYFEGLRTDGRSKYEIETKDKPTKGKYSETSSSSFSSAFEDVCSSETEGETNSSLETTSKLGKAYEIIAHVDEDQSQPSTSLNTYINQSHSRSLESATTIISQETTTGSTTSRTSTDYYGETDWYMDILLRMQALDMKQQSLMVQYDFLGKLANQNQEDFTKSRDWARYETDLKKSEVY